MHAPMLSALSVAQHDKLASSQCPCYKSAAEGSARLMQYVARHGMLTVCAMAGSQAGEGRSCTSQGAQASPGADSHQRPAMEGSSRAGQPGRCPHLAFSRRGVLSTGKPAALHRQPQHAAGCSLHVDVASVSQACSAIAGCTCDAAGLLTLACHAARGAVAGLGPPRGL